jgi:hypothetical protein
LLARGQAGVVAAKNFGRKDAFFVYSVLYSSVFSVVLFFYHRGHKVFCTENTEVVVAAKSYGRKMLIRK